MKLAGKKINLRRPTKKDAKHIAVHASHKDISRFTEHIPHPYKLSHAHEFIKKISLDHKKDSSHHFGIENKETGELIGMISLNKIDLKNKNAEVGYWVSRKFWRQGIGSESVGLVLEYAFDQLKLKRVYAKVHEMNKASAKLLEKKGFELEGKMRRHHFKNGKFVDVLVFGIVKK